MSTSKKYTVLSLAFFTVTTVSIIAFTFYVTIRFSYNFGLGRDEATFIIQGLINLISADGWSETVIALLPAKAHQVALGMTTSTLLSYWLLGSISVKFINAFNVLLLCLAGCLILHSYTAKTAHKILLAAIIFPLILSPVHNECMLIASCPGSHYYGLAMSVGALYFFSRATTGGRLIIAEFFCIASILSAATGILVPIAGVYLLLKAKPFYTRNFLLAHIIISAIALFVYYCRTQPLTLATPPVSDITNILIFASWLIAYTLALMGTLAMWLADEYPIALLTIGIAISLPTIWLTVRNARAVIQQSYFLCGALLFLCMLMMISLGRFFEPIAARYATYNIFFLLFIILLFFRIHDDHCEQEGLPERKNMKYHILASVVLLHFTVSLYLYLPSAYAKEQTNKVCLERLHKQQPLNSHGVWCQFNFNDDEMRRLIGKAEKMGIYNPDD